YRELSASARQAEEQALLQTMKGMASIMGELKAFAAMSTKFYPVQVHDVSYVVDINEFDDFMTGAQVLVQRDGDKISKISMVLRNDNYEEEKIFTPAARTIDGVKQWRDETYCRRAEGVELKAQEASYS